MFDDLDDPKKQALLMLAAGLLSPVRGRGMSGFGEALGRGIPAGLEGYNQANAQKMRRAEEEQQKRLREMQMAEMQRGVQFGEALRSGYKPGAPASQTFAPADMETPSQFSPAQAPGMDFSRAMQIDPMRAIQAQQAYQSMTQKQGPEYKEVGGRLVAIGQDGNVKEAYAPPDKPLHQPGQTREIKSGRKIVTQEYDGSAWKTIHTSDMDKPEGPDKGPAAPQGYRYTPDGNLQAIPGGPADTKAGEKAEALEKRQGNALARADFVLGQTKKAIDETGVTTAGPAGAIARNIPGTGGYDLNKTVDSIKANIGFSELQAMREASPTGGALGQVAVQELNMLQSVLGSLDTAQSPDQLLKSLYAIEKHYRNWKRAVQESKRKQPSGGFRFLGREEK